MLANAHCNPVSTNAYWKHHYNIWLQASLQFAGLLSRFLTSTLLQFVWSISCCVHSFNLLACLLAFVFACILATASVLSFIRITSTCALLLAFLCSYIARSVLAVWYLAFLHSYRHPFLLFACFFECLLTWLVCNTSHARTFWHPSCEHSCNLHSCKVLAALLFYCYLFVHNQFGCLLSHFLICSFSSCMFSCLLSGKNYCNLLACFLFSLEQASFQFTCLLSWLYTSLPHA